jgi:hypothetical protein
VLVSDFSPDSGFLYTKKRSEAYCSEYPQLLCAEHAEHLTRTHDASTVSKCDFEKWHTLSSE